jgi:AcrR family transcriptional regulator
LRASSDEATRQRLLDAATFLFSERGFRRVTVRDICREAHANVSAVNYHFGDKLGLYREVVGRAIQRVHGDPTTDPGEPASPEDKLRHYVRTFVPRVAMPTGNAVWMMKLMRQEMQDPTSLAPWIAERAILPRIRFLSETIAELIGCTPDDARVRRCVISLQAQCLFYMPNDFRKVGFPDWHEPTPEEIEEAAEHIVEFTLAGIAKIAGRSAGLPSTKE